MSDNNKIGTIGWIDLTVPDAAAIRDFYKKVVGWKHEPVSMGEYNDFCMLPPSSDSPVGGICYAKGMNKDIPPAWIIYIVVDDIERSIEQVKELGGELISEIKTIVGQGRYSIIKDPAGVISALYQEIK